MELSRRERHSGRQEASREPRKYLVRKKDFDSRSSRLQIREANLRESLLVWKLKMPRPPFPRDWWQVIRLTVSIRDPQRKGQTRLFTFEITHLGTHKTAERYRSLLIPKTLIISDLPTRERERDFQRLRCFSNFSSFGRQLSVSVSYPKTTPRIFIFITHLRPSGWSPRERHAPSHMASVFVTLRRAPDPPSYTLIILKKHWRER